MPCFRVPLFAGCTFNLVPPYHTHTSAVRPQKSRPGGGGCIFTRKKPAVLSIAGCSGAHQGRTGVRDSVGLPALLHRCPAFPVSQCHHRAFSALRRRDRIGIAPISLLRPEGHRTCLFIFAIVVYRRYIAVSIPFYGFHSRTPRSRPASSGAWFSVRSAADSFAHTQAFHAFRNMI